MILAHWVRGHILTFDSPPHDGGSIRRHGPKAGKSSASGKSPRVEPLALPLDPYAAFESRRRFVQVRNPGPRFVWKEALERHEWRLG